MTQHPGFAAQLGYAIARGWITQTQADAAILIRYRNNDDAKKCAQETRRHARSWAHIRTQLTTRISDMAAHNLPYLPPNAVRAQAHDLNTTQVLSEDEVNQAVERAEDEFQREQDRRNRQKPHRRG